MTFSAFSSTLELAAAAAFALAPFAAAQTPTAVSPYDRDRLEGSASTVYPLGRAHARVQQLLDDLPTQPRTWQGHAYRRDAITVRGLVSAFRSELSVLVSLSPRTAANASSTFADNTGTAQTVLAQTWVSFPQTDRPALDPAPTFELQIPWSTPYAWQGAGTLCLETLVHGNDVGGTADRNFSVYIDAHDLSRSSSRQPGFRFGSGCAAQGSTTASYSSFELVRTATRMDLDVGLRYGVPTGGSTGGLAVLMLGTTPVTWSWPSRPTCTIYTAPLTTEILGPTDASGHLDTTLTGVGFAPAGHSLLAQVLTLDGTSGNAALTDASRLSIPTPPQSTLLHARIANGDDQNAATGTVSYSVPVVALF
ncbi:MAG: hypothetical protein R3F56_19045 [Planctomycetota bacterium]